jgi:hypothetical protein
MHYVKHFNINGVDTKQVACIELHGKPNAATEGALGILGIDVDSSSHDVYKCVAVNGSIYTWELLSSGMSIMRAVTSGRGVTSANFQYSDLTAPVGYVVKVGDLIIDVEGYLYQVISLNSYYCVAEYCGAKIFPKKGVDYYTEAEKNDIIFEIKGKITGDIHTALDAIIAIQESLISISFFIDGEMYKADKDMTWREWINSSYNTIGMYLDENGNPLFADGCLIQRTDNYLLMLGEDKIIPGMNYTHG